MTHEPFPPASEFQDESIERPLAGRGAGAIFHIRDTDQFLFFLRDEKDWIPFPGMIDIIGGHMEPENEDAKAAAMRELGEELEYEDTGEPYLPDDITHFKTYVDERNVEQNIFGCELDTMPKIRTNEGQGLVLLSRADLATTEFGFHYRDVVLEYAASVPALEQ